MEAQIKHAGIKKIPPSVEANALEQIRREFNGFFDRKDCPGRAIGQAEPKENPAKRGFQAFRCSPCADPARPPRGRPKPAATRDRTPIPPAAAPWAAMPAKPASAGDRNDERGLLQFEGRRRNRIRRERAQQQNRPGRGGKSRDHGKTPFWRRAIKTLFSNAHKRKNGALQFHRRRIRRGGFRLIADRIPRAGLFAIRRLIQRHFRLAAAAATRAQMKTVHLTLRLGLLDQSGGKSLDRRVRAKPV